MRLHRIPPLVATVAFLAACNESAPKPPAHTPLPPIPADIQACLKGAGVKIPDRALTVGEVERLWGQDRLRIVVMRRCGGRLIAWYEELRANWK
jgi:hypothetical protein